MRAEHDFVRAASAVCRQMDGYVSFSAVEGLGGPPDSVDDGESRAGRLFEFFFWGGGTLMRSVLCRMRRRV